MPLVAYQGPHGDNDFPLHFAFLEAMEQRGILDKVDFAIDPFHDLAYCKLLRKRFPQLQLTTERSVVSKLAWMANRRLGIGAGRISKLPNNKFDAVFEGPGGRIHPLYQRGDLFWRFPSVKRRAVLFHSVEEGILSDSILCASLKTCDLIVARSSGAHEVALRAGVSSSKVCIASDIVLRQQPELAVFREGIAVALRVPNDGASPEYKSRMLHILDHLDELPRVDHVPIEAPLDVEQTRRGYGLNEERRLYRGNEMYEPFKLRRTAIISCRLHTTLIALLNGNRKILQYQVEGGTNKLQQIFHDIGLYGLEVRSADRLNVEEVQFFLEGGPELDDAEVITALKHARTLVEHGLDRACEWLLGL